jgi:hypothetical protein
MGGLVRAVIPRLPRCRSSTAKHDPFSAPKEFEVEIAAAIGGPTTRTAAQFHVGKRKRRGDSMQVSNVKGGNRLASQKRVGKRLMGAFNGHSMLRHPQAS